MRNRSPSERAARGDLCSSTGGWCDSKHNRIVVDSDIAPNARLRTLVHEAIHALGVDYQHYPRAQAEVIVDSVTLVVLGGLGLDVSGETIPYIAGWGEDGALEAVTQFAQLIDSLAHRVETALSTAGDTQGTAAALSVWQGWQGSRTHVECGHVCSSAESRREFSAGADDCVSSLPAAVGVN